MQKDNSNPAQPQSAINPLEPFDNLISGTQLKI